MSAAGSTITELGFYALSSNPASDRDVVEEVQDAERLGFGTAVISERFGERDATTIAGAAAAASNGISVMTAATNHNVRHPMVTASFARTMQGLTNNRFVLGIGRGIERQQDAYGIARCTTAEIERFAATMRQLFRGEIVMSENADRHALFLDSDLNQYLPMSLAAFGDASLKLGGRCFDHVVLHPFLTAETTAHCARVVRASAERAGRDPSTVKIWASLVTTGDYLDQELQLRKTVGQLTMYLQLYGNRLAAVNGWNKATLDQILADPIVSWVRALEARGTCQQLEHVASLIPRPWWENTAVGSPANCVATIGRQFQLGCDGVILHGSAPRQLAPIIDCYRHITESAESEPR